MENITTNLTTIDNNKLKRYLLLIGDLHFGRASNDQSELDESVRYFHEFLFPLLERMNEKCDGNVSIIQMGDVFDNKSSVGTLTGNNVIDIFLKLASKNDVYVLVGNHDTVYKDIRHINNNKSISLIPRVNVIPNITKILTESGTPAFLLPNYGNKELFKKAIDLCDDSSYIFGHDEISGFHYEGKEVSEIHSLPMSEFERFKHVFMGHIHKPQDGANITYVGSAYHTRVNEWRNVPQIVILDTETGKIQKIENKVSSRYVKIDLFKFLDMRRSEALGFVKGNNVVIQCPNDTIMRFQTPKITQSIEGYKKIDYKQVFDKNQRIGDGGENVDLDEDGNLQDISNVELSSDIFSYINDYLQSIDSVVIQGTLIPLSEKSKLKISESLKKIYDSVSEKSKPEDQE